MLHQKQVAEAKKELESITKLENSSDLLKIKDERLPALFCYIISTESDKEKTLKYLQDLMNDYAKLATTQSKNIFYEKSRIYLSLYNAQLCLAKGDYKSSMKILSEIFQISSRLCKNENFVVFALSVMKKLIKVLPESIEIMIKIIKDISKELSVKNEKEIGILIFLADTAMSIGMKGYQTAYVIYELLYNEVFFLTFYAQKGNKRGRNGLYFYKMCSGRGRARKVREKTW